MLDFLHIENIAVAKSLDINFHHGFNVLTGETGAGKSVIIGSINLLLGAKANKDIIRYGENFSTVSAFFSNVSKDVYDLCDELGVAYDVDDVFSISRTYTSEGKNNIRINSRPATLMQLKLIGSKLINIHGQNENHSFMDKTNHIYMLDEYAENHDLIDEYKILYDQLTQKKSEISRLIEQNKQTRMMLDALKLQIKEISFAKLKEFDEEERLTELKLKLKGAEKIVKNSSNVYKLLLQNDSGVSAVVLIEKAIDALKRLENYEPSAKELYEKLNNFKFEIEDIAETVLEYKMIQGIEDPDKQLTAVEDRLALINQLQKKYGPTIKDIIKHKEDAEKRILDLERGEGDLEDLKCEYKELYSKASTLADRIHVNRLENANKLGALVKKTLMFLDMPKVKFKISVEKITRDNNLVLSSNGYDNVEFLIATNSGEELAQMNKIASGGELSRIMLALKSTLSNKKGAQTIIFDEIDTGVSGSTSQKIGIKLAQIAKDTQTICVTHSAQIAALSSTHFLIKKEEKDGRAETSVRVLNDRERIDEIARIIGGIDLTEKQFAAANELIAQSKDILNEEV
ncbi:MAG: DNA repair protein RecN [Clostridia bacterium]|nr:DNA repair protein RecN [Clostridia bacterium]